MWKQQNIAGGVQTVCSSSAHTRMYGPRFSLRPGHAASSYDYGTMPYLGHALIRRELMPGPSNPLVALSNDAAKLVERAASSVVTVHGGGRWSSSGIHWRSGIIVTAEEILERDEDIKVTLPGGRAVVASLVGRDPSTDVAVLRFQPDGLAAALTADAASLRPGHAGSRKSRRSIDRQSRHRRPRGSGLARSSRRHNRQSDPPGSGAQPGR